MGKKLSKAKVSTTTIHKLAVGVVLVGLAFNGAFNFLNEVVRDEVSDTVIKVVAAVIVAVLVFKLAQCDNNGGGNGISK